MGKFFVILFPLCAEYFIKSKDAKDDSIKIIIAKRSPTKTPYKSLPLKDTQNLTSQAKESVSPPQAADLTSSSFSSPKVFASKSSLFLPNKDRDINEAKLLCSKDIYSHATDESKAETKKLQHVKHQQSSSTKLDGSVAVFSAVKSLQNLSSFVLEPLPKAKIAEKTGLMPRDKYAFSINENSEAKSTVTFSQNAAHSSSKTNKSSEKNPASGTTTSTRIDAASQLQEKWANAFKNVSSKTKPNTVDKYSSQTNKYPSLLTKPISSTMVTSTPSTSSTSSTKSTPPSTLSSTGSSTSTPNYIGRDGSTPTSSVQGVKPFPRPKWLIHVLSSPNTAFSQTELTPKKRRKVTLLH